MLRYGRPAPDYSMSNGSAVSVQMANTAADLDFFKMVVEQEDKQGNMPIDSLIILSRLREQHRLTTADLAPSVQKTEANVRAMLEKLVETGFLEPHSTGRGRTYTLSVRMYQKVGQQAEYVRQTGFAPIQQEQMVLKYIATHGDIKRADAADLCRISLYQATRLLKRMEKNNLIMSAGQGRRTRYEQK